MTKAKRKYSDTFHESGFTFTGRGDDQLSRCIVCCKVSAQTYWDYEIRLLVLLQSLNYGKQIYNLGRDWQCFQWWIKWVRSTVSTALFNVVPLTTSTVWLRNFVVSFPVLNTTHVWWHQQGTLSEFVKDFPSEQNDDEGIQEELDMIHDLTVKASFEDESWEKFRGMMEKAYAKVAEKPLTLLNVFPSDYLCESAFSSVVAVKSKNSKQIVRSGLVFTLGYLRNRTPYFIDCRQKKSKNLSNYLVWMLASKSVCTRHASYAYFGRMRLISWRHAQTKLQAPQNWNMKHYKLVEFFVKLNVKPPLHERKALPHKCKAPYWPIFGEGSVWSAFE